MLHDHETQRSEVCGPISMYMLCLRFNEWFDLFLRHFSDNYRKSTI